MSKFSKNTVKPKVTDSARKPESKNTGNVSKTTATNPSIPSDLKKNDGSSVISTPKLESKSRFEWPNFPDWEGNLSEYIEGVPNVSGSEKIILKAIQDNQQNPIFLSDSGIDFKRIRAASAVALHMHQPLIPAGGGDLQTAEIISNLKYMWDNQYIGDNHNAPVFHWCYKRLGEFIPQLVNEGKQPRVMLEYSGTLLHGLRQMGLHDVLDNLKTITLDHNYRRTVEWLGCPWGHAVAPSTPVQDYRLHVLAWQHHFAAIFGIEALTRVRGFSPSEMALPNHPDIAYEFVKTLKDCGFQWVLIQEHSVEHPSNGKTPERPHIPQKLVCTNSQGETASIIAIIKTQGSDTKLVAQMQPFYEAKGQSRWDLGGNSIPPLITQIADGENGGVMMNEFPPKFFEVANDCSGSDTPLMNVTEYLEHLFAMGIKEEDFPVVQPIMQKRIWEHFQPGEGPHKLAKVIETLKAEDSQFHIDGGSWTNDISWTNGYENVLGPMEQVSSLFYEKALKPHIPTNEHRYRNALFHLMSSQTSCYRYWGQGLWTDYGKEVCRRTHDILTYDF
ncbi:glycosyl hydrolase family 57 [Candidatus Parabeggiatoa sp. HSG14]|uniref:glycosyl hydrolase family 57 n=1 Tax=Candidatus Parabeggiatoa sp. HSG14 TaxID=3055593 RepID=UPI0025A92645|nr:hypothetical protein [Thiotrichales bacterium HSG14]